MNSKKSKTTNQYRPLLNLAIYYTWKNIKKKLKTINLTHQLQHGIKTLNYLMDHILDFQEI